MKVGILTLPLHKNYGGILQCYALFKSIEKLGHTPILIQRQYSKVRNWRYYLVSLLKATGIYYIYHQKNYTHLKNFVYNCIDHTDIIESHKKMLEVCNKYKFDVIIVGSDQVWRKSYAQNFGYEYFLDFVPDDVRKISYAASFGFNRWDYDFDQTKKIKHFLSNFHSISVREENAVKILEDNVFIKSEWVVDPTLLFTKDDYNDIISERLVQEKYIFIYWLGPKEIIEPEIKKFYDKGYRIIELYLSEKSINCSIQDWLSYIKYADYIITDSFHGVVFSLIFNCQFFVSLNKRGGQERIESLLKVAGLCEKLDNPELWVDYNKVNRSISIYRDKSWDFLEKAL